MAGNRLFVGVALMCVALVACTNANSDQQGNVPAPPIREVTTPPEATSTTAGPTTTLASALTTPGATTTTTPAATTTTTINLNFDTTKVSKLLDNPSWWTSIFSAFPLNDAVTLSTPQDRFGSTEAQQRAITDGFVSGLRRASAPPSPSPASLIEVTVYLDTFGSAAQLLDAVSNIYEQTGLLGLLTTVKIQSKGQTVFIWKPNSNPGLDLFYSAVPFGPVLLSIYGKAMNMTDAEIQAVAAEVIAAENAAMVQVTPS